VYEPRHLTDDDTLFFMHIPKTAGTGLRHFMIDRLPMKELNRDQWVSKTLTALIASGLSRPLDIDARFVCGHYPLSLVRRFKRKPHVVTFLREPLSRTLSLFFYLRRSGRLPADRTLEDFLRRSSQATDLMNIQTRWLADFHMDGVIERFSKQTELVDAGDDLALHLDRSLERYSDTLILDQALANMEEFAFCGITDRMDESTRLLCRTFGWPITGGVPVINRGAYHDKARNIPASTIELIREYNSLDSKLYAEGIRRLEEAASRPNPVTADILRHARFSETGENYVFIDPSGPIQGTNWHEPEMETLGNWTGGFRWTGPENPARLIVPVPRTTDLRVVFQLLLDPVTDRNCDSLRMVVNGTSVPLSEYSRTNLAMFEGVIERDLLEGRKDATLDFFVDEYVRPCDLFESNDERLLGVRFSWILLCAMDR